MSLHSAHVNAFYAHRRGETQIVLDDLIITVSERRPDGSFAAWFGDYDLNCMTGWGMTRVAAASDLLDTENDRRISRLERGLA